MKQVNPHNTKNQLSQLLTQPIKPRKNNSLKKHKILQDIKLTYNPIEPLSADEWPLEN